MILSSLLTRLNKSLKGELYGIHFKSWGNNMPFKYWYIKLLAGWVAGSEMSDSPGSITWLTRPFPIKYDSKAVRLDVTVLWP